MSPDFKIIGVIALTAHKGGKQPTNAKALNKAATHGASEWAAAFRASTLRKPSVADRVLRLLIPCSMSLAVKEILSSEPSVDCCGITTDGTVEVVENLLVSAGICYNSDLK